jgi:hypothetical protein
MASRRLRPVHDHGGGSWVSLLWAAVTATLVTALGSAVLASTPLARRPECNPDCPPVDHTHTPAAS